MKMVRFRLGLAFAFVAVVGCENATRGVTAVPVGADSPGQAAAAAVHRVTSRSTQSVELYVGDAETGVVSVFAISGGLPVESPVRTLDTNVAATNIAVAADGTIYVGGTVGSPSEVAVYAPGAQGSALPERVLQTPNGTAWSLAVDAAGYLYAGIFGVGVEVFAPGARGNDAPVATIPEQGFTGGLALDAAGNLYVTNDATGLTEYGDPESTPTEIRNTCFNVSTSLNGVAVAPDGTAYLAVDGASHQPRRSFLSPIAPSDNGCPVKRHRLYAVPKLHNPIGVAEYAGNLFVADTEFDTGTPVVVVMDEARRGHKPPLFVLTDSSFKHPRGVAIGP